jgi:hypothetical protein
MYNNITPVLNENNVENIRAQISQKTQPSPFFATAKDAIQTITDYDTFPYPRYYRGVIGAHQPVVAEREAGWRKRQDACYDVREPKKSHIPPVYPNNCFQTACSTVYPCYPEYMTKYSDKEAMDLILNKTCVAQYR